MSERINIDIILNSEEVNIQDLKTWVDIMSYFNPISMMCKKLTRGKFRKFNKEIFYKNIESELFEEDNSIIIKDDRNYISIYRNSNKKEVISLLCILEQDIFEENKKFILSLLNKFMVENKGIVAHVCSLDDWFWQNNEDLHVYQIRSKSIENIKIKKSEIFTDKDIVDIEFNPGHFHNVNGLMFGSCWMMWYGEGFFKYIPKQVLENFKECYENKQISEDCIRITLYENPWQYGKEENRDKQWSFRKNVGIDEIVSILEENNDISDDIDATIEISEGEFEHGGIRLFKYYYDAEDNLVEKSKAFKSIIYELDKDGKIVWSNLE